MTPPKETKQEPVEVPEHEGQQGLTAEQAMAAGATGRAAVEAAAAAPEGEQEQAAATAIREEADRRGLEISDAQIKQLSNDIVAAMRSPETAKVLAAGIADEFRQQGAFDPPPERVMAPAPSPAEQQLEGAQDATDPANTPAGDKQPRKLTLAERMGF